MASLIERYVYDVIRRLPEKDREEVKRELTANIYDMLSDTPSDEEVASVLNSLGSPAELAQNYRQKPRYLISPAVYDDYIRALKWIVPLVGVILLIVGAVLGALESIEEEPVTAAVFFTGLFSTGLSLGISGAFQALIWTTIGFVIADRTGARTAEDKKAWTIDELPETIEDDKSRIALSDTIVELVVIVVFSAAAVMLCMGAIPFSFAFRFEGFQVDRLFAPEFLMVCVPIIIVGAALGILECVAKIVVRRWSPVVCGLVVVSNLVSIALVFVLASQPDILSPEFVAFAKVQGWWTIDWLKIGTWIPEMTVARAGVITIVAIVVIASVAESISAIYRTIRAGKQSRRVTNATGTQIA